MSDAIGNRIVEIDDPLTRDTSAGVGRRVTADGFLRRPLALATAPNGHLLATNAQNGCRDRSGSRQADLRALDQYRQGAIAPGNGNLFGIAMTPEGDGFYYVADDVNTLLLAK